MSRYRKEHPELKKIEYRRLRNIIVLDPEKLEKERKKRRDYYYRSRERRKNHFQEHYLKNRDTILPKRKIRIIKIRESIMDLLGGRFCRRCGFSDWRALQIDHIKGGGSKERKNTKNSYPKLFANVKSNLNSYQILCANCNWIKRAENEENISGMKLIIGKHTL